MNHAKESFRLSSASPYFPAPPGALCPRSPEQQPRRSRDEPVSCMSRLRATLLLAAPLAALLGAGPAHAAEDVFNIDVFARQRYDSNLFRLPDGVQPFGDGRRSATTRSYGVGLNVNKAYGLQRFDISTTITRDSYDPYDYLDSTGRAYNASWAWMVTPSLSGNLSISRTEAPNNFSDTGVLTQENKRRTDQRRFDINFRPGASLHPRVSLLQNEDRSDQTTIDRQNSKTTSVESAMVYEFRSGNTTELYFRRGRGDYLDINSDPLLENDSQFDENETGAAAHWMWTGNSTFDGRIGYLDRKHRTFASRNFSGPVGSVNFTYALTGKTQLQLSANRTLSSTQSLTTSYSQDETISINPVYYATGKITVRPSYVVTRRSFKAGLVRTGDDLQMTMRDTSLSIDWNVQRALSLSVTLTRSNRTSNDAVYQFSDRAATIQAALRF